MPALRFSLLFCLCALLLACESSSQKAEQSKTSEELLLTQLEEQVNRLHDSLMAKMDDLHRAYQALEAIAATDSQRVAPYLQLIDAADEAMMAWMRAYQKPQGASYEELVEFFKREHLAIDSVGVLMKKAVTESEAFLKQYAN